MAEPLFGIECEHHFGITTHAFRDGMTAPETVYWLIRNAWHTEALTDDNHTWDVVEANSPSWSRIRIIKNDKSPRFLLCPSWYGDGPGALWFSQEYRLASATTIAWEIAGRIAQAERCETDAARQRNTIRGRKAAQRYSSIAKSCRREAELIRSRWPEYEGGERTGWQTRLHEHRVHRTPESHPHAR